MIKLLLKEVEDEVTRENFQRIEEYLRDESMLKGQFQHMVIAATDATPTFKIRHGLNFQPLDVIQTFQSDSAVTVTWNYTDFDREFLNLTVSGPVTIRAFVGRYRNG